MSRTPTSAEVRTGLLASIAFTGLGGALLSSGLPDPVLRLAAWAMLGLGVLGVVAILARMRGRWQPEAVDWPSRFAALPLVGAIARWRAARRAREREAWLARINRPMEGERPVLADSDRALAEPMVDLLRAEGVLGAPVGMEHLAEGLAAWVQNGWALDQRAVLGALPAAQRWHPDFDAAAAMANLAFHEEHVEQGADAVRDQIADLARLAGASITVRALAFELAEQESGPASAEIDIDGRRESIRWQADAKYLALDLHEAVARLLRARGGYRRLAWLIDDSGCWIAALGDGGVDRLNSGAGAIADGHGGWRWIDAGFAQSA